MPAVELTRFRVRPDQTQALLATRPGMIDAFQADRSGFLGAQLVRLDDDQWLDIVWWDEPAHFHASRAKGGNLPAIAAFFDAIDQVLSSELGGVVSDDLVAKGRP